MGEPEKWELGPTTYVCCFCKLLSFMYWINHARIWCKKLFHTHDFHYVMGAILFFQEKKINIGAIFSFSCMPQPVIHIINCFISYTSHTHIYTIYIFKLNEIGRSEYISKLNIWGIKWIIFQWLGGMKWLKSNTRFEFLQVVMNWHTIIVIMIKETHIFHKV